MKRHFVWLNVIQHLLILIASWHRCGLPGSSLSRVQGYPQDERCWQRNEWHGETKLRWVRPVTLFSEGAFIPWVVHWAKWKRQSHAESAQHSISINFYQYQVSSCIPFHKQGSYFLYIIFWPGGLLTFYDHFLIKVGQLEHLLFLKCFFLNSLACITLKV